MLANLDNEVIFKKVFTDKEIFTGFVKDVLEIDFKVGKIETEKQFKPKIGNIDFKLDIFAESEDDRIAIELQKIEYDNNFDRFLHYFLMSIAELQRNYRTYKINKTVYGIVVVTAPYTITTKDNQPILNEVLVTNLNPRSLGGEEVKMYNHCLTFLNPYHKEETTPPAVRDWLDLIYQSIHAPERPTVNINNPLIQKAVNMINVDNLTPEELTARKQKESRRVMAKKIEQIGINKGIDIGIDMGIEQVAIRGIKRGRSNEDIADMTGLSVEEIEHLRKTLDD